ncbi:MAG: hypothetical protein IJO31_07820 [Oscillospiraceae bacterium]|nr:hypothetical protein [Oscillospiraceae bacterium]
MLENKVVRWLVSFLVAFTLWFYVITVVSTEYDQSFSGIPVSFQGEAILEERGLMIVSNETPTVELQLYGKRSDLSKLDNSNITVTVDVSKIGEAGEHQLSTGNISYPGDVRNDAISVLNRSPSTITLLVEQKIKKEIPVNIVYTGTVQEEFIADKENALLDYTMVSIAGPASTIDQITQAVIEVDLNDKNESFSDSYTYTLCDKAGAPVDAAYVETNIASVNLTLYIQRVKEIPLVVTVVEGGGATENTTVVELSQQTLKISGNDMVLEQLNELTLGTIDLAAIPEDTILTFPVVLPTGVTNLSNVAEIQVKVSFPELATKTFTVTNIKTGNIPADMEAEVLTQSMQVTLRGPKALIGLLTPDDLIIVVNLADAQPGTFTVKGNVVLSSQYSACGPIKSDSVSVTLRSTLEAQTDDPEGNG